MKHDIILLTDKLGFYRSLERFDGRDVVLEFLPHLETWYAAERLESEELRPLQNANI